MNRETALRNIVLTIQDRPADYHKFGPYWWPVKVMLRHAGYGRDQLTVLGDFVEPGAEDLIAEKGALQILQEALKEYRQSHYTGMLGSMTRDGNSYLVSDPDAGGL